MMTDNDLMALLESDPEEGLRQTVSQYSRLVYAVVSRRIGNTCARGDIEETVSDVFYEFYCDRSRIEAERGGIRAFLVSLAGKRAVDRFRRESGKPVLSLDDEENGLADVLGDGSPEEDIASSEERARLIGAVKALGQPDSTIVLRRFWLDEGMEQIAAVVGLSRNAVQKRLVKCMKKLERALSGEQNG